MIGRMTKAENKIEFLCLPELYRMAEEKGMRLEQDVLQPSSPGLLRRWQSPRQMRTKE